MTASETAVRPPRRAGTFTLGIVLIVAGTAMLVSLFWPRADVRWLLKASPVILILLGTEVLLAARGGGKVKYDWVGMFLCFILVGAGLTMYAAAWYVENGEYFSAYDCSRFADETSYRMSYHYFDGFDSHTLELEAGDVLEVRASTWNGVLEAEIGGEDGETLWETSSLNGEESIEISKTGDYTILVHGRRAGGSFLFEAVQEPPGESSGPEEPKTPPAAEALPGPEAAPEGEQTA